MSDAPPVRPGFPENPVLARLWRGSEIESQHRGAWALLDATGRVVSGAGSVESPFFARSTLKCLQALPLIESGAAERFGVTDEELAVAVASHDAEPCHTETVAGLLARIGCTVADLGCGAHPPGDSRTRTAMACREEAPSALHNNCSGKHAAFLALALHLGVPRERYLDPESEGQRLVKRAVAEMTDLPEEALTSAVDGCSAPTFRLPLAKLALAFARVANPGGLEAARRGACRRITDAVAAHPHLVGGHTKRLCSDLVRVSEGRLFAKIGGEAVYALGVRGAGLGLAVKIDDGGPRALGALVTRLLARFDLATRPELEALAVWHAGEQRNWAGLEVGRLEVLA